MSEVRGYLDELPSELQVLIAKHLDRYSIVSFRSTSHRLLAASHHVFVAEYFTTRVHLVSRYALRALVDICANPLWTAKLQQIELVFGDIYMPKPHEIDNTRLRGKGIVKIDREYDDLFHNNYHRRLLREMFAHLNRAKRRGVAITVGRTKEDDGGPVFGYEKLERLIGCRLDLGVGHPERSQEFVRGLLTAAASTGYMFSALSIFEGDDNRQISEGAFTIPSRLIDPLRTCWSTLTRLTLGHFQDGWYGGGENHFRQLFSSAINLEEFDLRGHREVEDTMYFWMTWMKTTSLRKLWLEDMSGCEAQFVRIFEQNKAALREVRLRDCAIHDAECWLDVFEYAARNLDLTYFIVVGPWYIPSGQTLKLAQRILCWQHGINEKAALEQLEVLRVNDELHRV